MKYKIYEISSKNKTRKIQEPVEWLKNKQKELIPLFEKFPVHLSSYGTTKGKGTIDCIELHREADIIFKTDISRFYESTTLFILAAGLSYAERNLGLSTHLKYKMLNTIAFSCLYRKKTRSGCTLTLPTGAPTSPILSNIACCSLDYEYMDRIIKSVMEQMNIKGTYKYTRYIDDIIISWKLDNAASVKDIDLNDLKNKISKNIQLVIPYTLSVHKTRCISKESDARCKILGVTINKKNEITIPKEKRKELRHLLFKLISKQSKLSLSQEGILKQAYLINIEQMDKIAKYYLLMARRLEDEAYTVDKSSGNCYSDYLASRIAYYKKLAIKNTTDNGYNIRT